jgi:NAD(P)-dependent dehydrogenase (short-subunit alcohol dehydrogenase family)
MAQAIFITGGGSGIGRATAQLFAAKGWFVGLADINERGIDETGALLPNSMWSKHVMDVRDAEAWDVALKDFAAKSGGRLDVFFNNAGIGTGGPIADAPVDEIEKVIAINLTGSILGARAAYPYLKATKGSAMVTTSSAAGIYAGPNMVSYSATKFGVRAMTESLSREWAPDGIKARTIMPSFIDTPLLDATSRASNTSFRDTVREAGLEFTPVEQVAQAVWDAAHGQRIHTMVGKTARRLRFATRFAPWLLPKGLVDKKDQA